MSTLSKCTLEISDNEDGTFKVIYDPPFEKLQRMHKGGHAWTPAEGIFLTVMLHLWKHAQKEENRPKPDEPMWTDWNQ